MSAEHYLSIGVPTDYVAKGPEWGGRETFECRLCPKGFYRELVLERMVGHLEHEHGVLLGQREEVSSTILGPDGKPAKKVVPASVFGPD